jgi:hypothetical protein
MIEIEKGVPIPERRGNWTKYPWGNMEVGDSFFVKRSGKTTLKLLQNNLSTLSRRVGKSIGVKFKTSQEEKGVRVWRIA